MPLSDAALQNYIREQSVRRGLDPDAVLAVATVEGGFGGAVGDSGSSYGPFQLHVGGALPAGRSNAWARSNAGISYALNKIASVAKGLTGKDAISAIVTKFERPAAPQAEIDKAVGVYRASPSTSATPVAADDSNNPPKRGGVFGGIGPLGMFDPNDPVVKKAAEPISVLSALGKKDTYVRAGEGIAGVICLFMGISLLAKELGIGDSALRLISAAAPVGKVASAAKGVIGKT